MKKYFLPVCSVIEGEKQVKFITERANACNRKIIWILSVVALAVWIAVIWGNSFQNGDFSHRISNAALRWFNGALAYLELTWRPTGLQIRKAAHFAEYFLLGIFAAGWMRSWKLSWIIPLGLCVCVPLVDELLIQCFVDGRLGKMSDVWLDWGSAACGVLMCLAARQIFRRHKNALTK